MNHLDRVLADSADRAHWNRDSFIGASDAANYAREESIQKYILAKLKDGRFQGNAYTEAGHRWEPEILDWFGVPHNTLTFHAEGERGFAATPDGIEVLPSGELVLAEVKVIHGRVHTGPTPAHLRQIWWAQYVLGARRTKYLWRELVDGVPRRLEPHIQIIERDDAALSKLLRIARPVLAGVRAAREFERSLAA
ncbi:MAG: recombinase [Leifsonia sp.]